MIDVKLKLANNLTVKGPPSRLAIADSGCTDHFVPSTDNLDNPTKAIHPITIQNPNGSYMNSTHIGQITIPGVPAAGRTAHVVPKQHANPLLSIGKFCDAESDVLSPKTESTSSTPVQYNAADSVAQTAFGASR